MSKRNKILIVLGVVLGLVLLFIFTSGQRQKNTVSDYTRLHGNMQFAQQIDNSMYFYSGSFFAKYDIGRQKTERLSDYLLIGQGIQNVGWHKEGVTFQTTRNEGSYDDLSVAIANLAAPKLGTYWWNYDFATKQYQLLKTASSDSCQELTYYKENTYICLPLDVNTQQSKSISLITTNGTKEEVYKSETPIRNMKIEGDRIHFITTNSDRTESLKTVSIQTKQTNDDYKSKGFIVSYEASGSTLGVIWKEQEPADLEKEEVHDNQSSKYNVSIRNNTKETSKKSFTTSRLNTEKVGADIFIVNSNGEVHRVVDNKLVLEAASRDKEQTSIRYAAKNDGKYYLVGIDNAFYGDTDKIDDTLRDISEFDPDGDNDPSVPLFINTPSSDRLTNVQLYASTQPFTQQALIVDRILKEDFFDPSEFIFDWNINSTSNQIPLTPNATIL